MLNIFASLIPILKSALINDTIFSRRFMKNREPYDIKHIIIAYNLFQTVCSFWGFSEGWKYVYVEKIRQAFVLRYFVDFTSLVDTAGPVNPLTTLTTRRHLEP